MAADKVKFILEVDEKGAISSFKKFEKAGSDAGKKVGKEFDGISKASGKASKQVVDQWKKSFGLIVAALGTAGLAKSFLTTAMSMEKFEVQLKTILGTSKKAKESMGWIREFTKSTPYEMDQVTEAFVKLSAYGFDAVRWIPMLGDAASGMGKDLIQAVEAFADAATGEFERLKEFGVKTRQEGDKVTFSWNENGKEMRKTVEKNSTAITQGIGDIFKRFQGAMEEQSKTMQGIWSNLKGQWTDFQVLVMDAGIYEELKIELEAIAKAAGDWVEENKELIKQKIPEYIEDAKTGLQGIWDIYQAIPDGALEWGLIGSILFGRKVGAIIATIITVNGMLDKLGDFIDKNVWGEETPEKSWKEIIEAFDDVFSGRRDWNTGEWKGEGPDPKSVYRGKIDSSTPGYGAYKSGDTGLGSPANPITITPTTTSNPYTYTSTDSMDSHVDLYEKQEALLQLQETERNIEKNKANRERERQKESMQLLVDTLKEKEEAELKHAEHMKEIEDGITDSFASGLTDSLLDFIDGTKSAEDAFKQFASSFLREIAQMIIKQQILNALESSSASGGVWGAIAGAISSAVASADGNVFSGGRLVPFASGGVINSPKIFPMANGYGLAGEAGPEAIMPLKRGSDGKLGVAGGGGGVNINNTINIENGDKLTDPNEAKKTFSAMAVMIREQVRGVLTDEKRVGGMLNTSINRRVI
jgi:hypothetical protein